MSDVTARHREWGGKIDDALCHAECTCRNHARRHLTCEERVDVIAAKFAALESREQVSSTGRHKWATEIAEDLLEHGVISGETPLPDQDMPTEVDVNDAVSITAYYIESKLAALADDPPQGLEAAVRKAFKLNLMNMRTCEKSIQAIIAAVQRFCQTSKPVKELEAAVRECFDDTDLGGLLHGWGTLPNRILAAVQPGYDILRAETATQHRKIGELQADNDTLKKQIEHQREIHKTNEAAFDTINNEAHEKIDTLKQRVEELEIKYLAAKSDYNTCRPLLDTAVGLLGKWEHTGESSKHKGGMYASQLHIETTDFLAQDAIVAILKQKGQ